MVEIKGEDLGGRRGSFSDERSARKEALRPLMERVFSVQFFFGVRTYVCLRELKSAFHLGFLNPALEAGKGSGCFSMGARRWSFVGVLSNTIFH